jgi:hypothetical protein
MRTTSLKKGEVTVNKSYSPIEVSRVYSNTYQKEGTETAELKQTVVTESIYPTKSVASNLQENIFDNAEFGFANQTYENSSVRVAWLDVPVGTTAQQVAERLTKMPDATIVQILSNHPILTDKQVYAIENGITTKEVIAESQVMRFGENAEENAGKLILDKLGRPIYKGNYFRTSAEADIDRRKTASTPEEEAAAKADFFATEAILAEMAELAGVSTGIVTEQTVF